MGGKFRLSCNSHLHRYVLVLFIVVHCCVFIRVLVVLGGANAQITHLLYIIFFILLFATLVGAGTSATTHSSFIATTTTCNKMHLTTPDLFPTMYTVYTGLYDSVPDVYGKLFSFPLYFSLVPCCIRNRHALSVSRISSDDEMLTTL